MGLFDKKSKTEALAEPTAQQAVQPETIAENTYSESSTNLSTVDIDNNPFVEPLQEVEPVVESTEPEVNFDNIFNVSDTDLISNNNADASIPVMAETAATIDNPEPAKAATAALSVNPADMIGEDMTKEDEITQIISDSIDPLAPAVTEEVAASPTVEEATPSEPVIELTPTPETSEVSSSEDVATPVESVPFASTETPLAETGEELLLDEEHEQLDVTPTVEEIPAETQEEIIPVIPDGETTPPTEENIVVEESTEEASVPVENVEEVSEPENTPLTDSVSNETGTPNDTITQEQPVAETNLTHKVDEVIEPQVAESSPTEQVTTEEQTTEQALTEAAPVTQTEVAASPTETEEQSVEVSPSPTTTIEDISASEAIIPDEVLKSQEDTVTELKKEQEIAAGDTVLELSSTPSVQPSFVTPQESIMSEGTEESIISVPPLKSEVASSPDVEPPVIEAPTEEITSTEIPIKTSDEVVATPSNDTSETTLETPVSQEEPTIQEVEPVTPPEPTAAPEEEATEPIPPKPANNLPQDIELPIVAHEIKPEETATPEIETTENSEPVISEEGPRPIIEEDETVILPVITDEMVAEYVAAAHKEQKEITGNEDIIPAVEESVDSPSEESVIPVTNEVEDVVPVTDEQEIYYENPEEYQENPEEYQYYDENNYDETAYDEPIMTIEETTPAPIIGIPEGINESVAPINTKVTPAPRPARLVEDFVYPTEPTEEMLHRERNRPQLTERDGIVTYISDPTPTRFCNNCGIMLTDDSSICPSCGEPID